jgi:acyl-CoA reductase-like NAD-dependent aldehyde dehydrogenase
MIRPCHSANDFETRSISEPAGTPARLQEARVAQPNWASVPVQRRLELIAQLRHRIATEPAKLLDTLAAPGRERAQEALTAEVLPLADACRFLERMAARLLARRRLGRRGRPAWLLGHHAEIRREPLGVVLVIGPNNYPLLLPGLPALQALTAGNAVLVKPAPGCSSPMVRLAEMLVQAGLPQGLFQVLDEALAETTAVIAAGVDHVVLTGSATTGRVVLRSLAETITPATLELSGSDAVFILPGADLDLAAEALVFGMRFNAGATCIAPRRVFVGEEDAPHLEHRLALLLAQEPLLPIEAAMSDRLSVLLDEAKRSGARFLPDFPRPEAKQIRPTVVLDADPAWALLREDFFAPVLAVVRVHSPQEALSFDASCRYTLGATVFGPKQKAERFAAAVNAGSVVINDLIVPTADPRLPFGGRGDSGYGLTRGAEGLLALTRVKAVAVRRGRFRPHFRSPDADQLRLAEAYLGAAHGTGLVFRFRAACALVSALKRSARHRSSVL